MKKILFVEDEERLQKALCSVLEEAGFEVLKADDGEIAMKILEEEKPDLILLDLVLPKKDGFDVLEYLKSDKDLKDIPVIVLSNLEEKFDIEKAMSYGARHYLVKANFRPTQIVEKIKESFK